MTQIRKPWKGTLTPRERFHNQMHFLPFDRCFNMEFGYWAENYRTWDIFVDNNIKTVAEANSFFGFDRFAAIEGNGG